MVNQSVKRCKKLCSLRSTQLFAPLTSIVPGTGIGVAKPEKKNTTNLPRKYFIEKYYLAKEIQVKLNELGYYNGTIDGEIDSKTQELIKKFIKDYNINVGEIVSYSIISEKLSEAQKIAQYKNKNPKSIYLIGGKYERENNYEYAKTAYEYIIDNYSDSEFAIRANDRLLIIYDKIKSSGYNDASDNKTGFNHLENVRKTCIAQCKAIASSCEAQCYGVSDKEGFLEISPQAQCIGECRHGEEQCMKNCP